MVKVLVYGYATGVFSSRKIARKLHEDVAFGVLGAGNFPAHRTICDFRALHLTERSALFVPVRAAARMHETLVFPHPRHKTTSRTPRAGS